MTKKQTRRYVALLRGINVGGKNIFSKDDLKACFETVGLQNVRTYIQSGNILFRATGRQKELTATIEKALSRRFSYPAQALVLSHYRYQAAVRAAPSDWGKDDERKHHAMFLLAGLSAKRALAQLPPARPGLEKITAAPGVIYWSASKAHLGKTVLMRLARENVYQQMTLRNHNTVQRILELFEEI